MILKTQNNQIHKTLKNNKLQHLKHPILLEKKYLLIKKETRLSPLINIF